MTIIHVFEFIFIPVQCDKAVRAELLANITLSGGNTKFPGIEKRVYQVSYKTLPTDLLAPQGVRYVYVYDCGNPFQELEGLLPVRSLKEALKVRALPHRDMLGWVGAARWSPQNKKWTQSLLYDQQVLCLADLLQSNVESWMSQNQL